jgi:hypothetical protein
VRIQHDVNHPSLNQVDWLPYWFWIFGTNFYCI